MPNCHKQDDAGLSLPAVREHNPQPLRVMYMTSTADFEAFFEDVLGFDRQTYLNSYRNDGVWLYCRVMQSKGIQPVIGIRSLSGRATCRTQDGILVEFLPVIWPWRLYRQMRRKRLKSASTTDVTQKHDTLPPDTRITTQNAPHHPVKAILRPVIRYIGECLSAIGSINYFRHADLDVVYHQEYWTGQFDVMALTSCVPVVGADHGGSAARRVRLLKPLSFRRAVCLTCQTRSEQHMAHRYGARAELLSNPIDTDFYCPSGDRTARPMTARTILVVARLTDEQKRVSDVINALSHLADDWELKIVGSGPDLGSLEALAVDLGVSHRVHFLGFVRDPVELRAQYRSCDVFVLASSHEAKSLVVLEALACGCAVALSDIPVFRELLDDCGEVAAQFPVGQPEVLAQAVQAAYERRKELGQRGRQAAVSHFSIEAFAHQFVNLLEEAAAARTHTGRA